MIGSVRADAIIQLITQNMVLRHPGWDKEYGLFGVLKG